MYTYLCIHVQERLQKQVCVRECIEHMRNSGLWSHQHIIELINTLLNLSTHYGTF
jgi:hypothetical protein